MPSSSPPFLRTGGAGGKGAGPMDDTSTTTANLDQADAEILTDEVSDEALEAAAGVDWGASYMATTNNSYHPRCCR